ncbi:MAG TPA: flagellar biosynthetic protein FliR [Stellaceae bacterium]|jgi:flagellar biosynthetic protein FliR|nr:flagellar biosynthetic protein FliR [Stellaceae bacterium]
MNINDFLPNNTFGALLIFARIGTAMMLLPGFGEVYVLQRYRLLFALIFSALLLPILSPILPPLPASIADLVVVLGSELVIGAFIGTITRVILAALQIAGQFVSMQTGLSYAQVFNPIEASQDSVPSGFYAVLGVLLIFLTNTHHLMLRGLVDSYAVFQPGHFPPIEDLSQTLAHAVSASFKLAMEMAAPFIVLGTIFMIGIGLIGRLVPQLQILFVTQPLQILGGLLLMGLLAATGMGWFLQGFTDQFQSLIPS